jgi:hypothetical protein
MPTLEQPSSPFARGMDIERGIEIRLSRSGGSRLRRRLEPVTFGIPLPRGAASRTDAFSLTDSTGRQMPCDVRALDRWADESIRWLLVDAQVDNDAEATPQYLLQHRPAPAGPGVPKIVARQDGARVHVDTGVLACVLAPGGAFPFERIESGAASAVDVSQCRFDAVDESDQACAVSFERVALEEPGALRCVVAAEGSIRTPSGEALLDLLVRLHFYAGSAAVRWLVRTRNPRKALHPDGYWDLGSGGSVLIRDVSLRVVLPGAGQAVTRCSPETGAAFETVGDDLELYQDSSGGKNWKSPNHVNRMHVVPNSFRGYRMRSTAGDRQGLRATPIVEVARGAARLSASIPHFWQNFPKAIEAAAGAVTVRLFPRQYSDLHEIQGGEQKTHELFLCFGGDTITSEPLAWSRDRVVAHALPSWYCESGAIPYLTLADLPVNGPHTALVNAAIEGEDTFERKREIVDEYGWRHFGDIYGDHEAIRHPGPAPLVSHYNNQYDPVGGFGLQFLRSADPRWWAMMHELAAHVVDIDIYHTEQDKSAYNHGLFWHTYHYGDADTATHRSYPRAGARVIGGGGPSADQNYTSGLMLHYFLTGDAASRDTVIDSAQYVIDADDGSKTIFRWLDRGYTGLATASGSYSYHGPGRSPANSVNALLDGYRLTRHQRFIEKAEQVIRRCVHPEQDIEALNLRDAENKWFYLMFLQSLGKYLDEKAEHGQIDGMYAYGEAALLHYARWMAEHERPFLDHPEQLEFPTETWAAQDIRKSDVFLHAAQHADGEERERFLERGEFFFQYAVTKLASMPTHTFARPVVLLLSNGMLHGWMSAHAGVRKPSARRPASFPAFQAFVPQKPRAMRRAMILAAAGASAVTVSAIYLLVHFLF